MLLDELAPFEGELLREPLRDLFDPYRRTVADDDERERREARDADPHCAFDAACRGAS